MVTAADSITLTVEPRGNGYAVAVHDEHGPLYLLPGSERATRAECQRLIDGGNLHVHPAVRVALNAMADSGGGL